jgi:hypothetical protein
MHRRQLALQHACLQRFWLSNQGLCPFVSFDPRCSYKQYITQKGPTEPISVTAFIHKPEAAFIHKPEAAFIHKSKAAFILENWKPLLFISRTAEELP